MIVSVERSGWFYKWIRFGRHLYLMRHLLPGPIVTVTVDKRDCDDPDDLRRPKAR